MLARRLTRRDRRTRLAALGACWLSLFAAAPAAAEVTARIVPTSTDVGVGAMFDVEIFADIELPVVGWGLDLAFDPTILSLIGTPVIAEPPWEPVGMSDDGLAGGAFPMGVDGDDVPLATLTFSALMEGISQLVLGASDDGATEGFALEGGGFDDIVFVNGSVTVVPEPATGLLLASGLLGLARRRA